MDIDIWTKTGKNVYKAGSWTKKVYSKRTVYYNKKERIIVRYHENSITIFSKEHTNEEGTTITYFNRRGEMTLKFGPVAGRSHIYPLPTNDSTRGELYDIVVTKTIETFEFLKESTNLEIVMSIIPLFANTLKRYSRWLADLAQSYYNDHFNRENTSNSLKLLHACLNTYCDRDILKYYEFLDPYNKNMSEPSSLTHNTITAFVLRYKILDIKNPTITTRAVLSYHPIFVESFSELWKTSNQSEIIKLLWELYEANSEL